MDEISVPREWVESITHLQLPSALESRRLELLQQNYQGRISEPERKELRTLMAINELLAQLSAEARNLLHGLPPDASIVTTNAGGPALFNSPEEAPSIDPAVVRWYVEEEGL